MHLFKLLCHRCSKESEIMQVPRTPEPTVNCGNCLMDHVEIIEMKIVKVEEIKP